jgi:co-chaperonin GroES (HSP10)
MILKNITPDEIEVDRVNYLIMDEDSILAVSKD